MDSTAVRVCLVSTPGSIRNATCATIANTPSVHLVLVTSGALSATQVAQSMQLDLILLDANIPEDEVSALLNWLAGQSLSVRSLVARMTSEQCHQALALGADEAVRRDELSTRLLSLINEFPDSGIDSRSTDQRAEKPETGLET